MTETSAPWNNVDMDEVGWRQHQSGGHGEGGIINDFTGDSLGVVASGASTTVTVSAGMALVQGVLYTNTAPKSLDVAGVGTAPTSGQTRIDMIVLRYDPAARTVTALVKAGAPSASSAAAPGLTRSSTGVWEVPLASIKRTGNVAVTSSMVTNRRTWLGPSGYAPGFTPPAAAFPVGSRLTTPSGELIRNGDGWLTRDQPGWTDLSLTSKLTAYEMTPAHAYLHGEVILRGGVQRSDGNPLAGSNATITIGVMPAGRRPIGRMRWPVATTFAGTAIGGRLTIDDTGQIEFAVPGNPDTTWCRLDGVRYLADN